MPRRAKNRSQHGRLVPKFDLRLPLVTRAGRNLAAAVGSADVVLQHSGNPVIKKASGVTHDDLAAEAGYLAQIEDPAERAKRILNFFEATLRLIVGYQHVALDFLRLADQLETANAQIRALQGITFNTVKRTDDDGGIVLN
jgi:hypothetical protein